MSIPKSILKMDEDDALAHKRDEFSLPENTIYMDGNSLGPLPLSAQQRVADVVSQQWGRDLISSWNKHQWIDLPYSIGDTIGALIGAAKGQVVCCDSTSVNLFKLLASALSLRPERSVILSQQDNFPTDLYMAEGLAELLGEQRCRLLQVDATELQQNLDESVAVLLLTHVNFRSGDMHDMQQLTKLAHEHGALVLWDLAHSAGAMPLQLDEIGVDFAVGCGYKYLNGSPGAPAFLYVASRHLDTVTQPLAGWMGHRSPFEFNNQYQAKKGVGQYLCGTPNILSMVALDAALEVFSGVDMQLLRDKSIALSELFRQQVSGSPALAELQLVSPTDATLRGSQLAFSHPHAYAVCQALIEHGVIVDFRAPDIIRFGFTPLYLRFADVWQAVETLMSIAPRRLLLYRSNKLHPCNDRRAMLIKASKVATVGVTNPTLSRFRHPILQSRLRNTRKQAKSILPTIGNTTFFPVVNLLWGERFSSFLL